jgi:hypothetical protein
MNKFTTEQTMTVLMHMNLPQDLKLAVHLNKNFDTPRNELFKACKQAIMLDTYGFDWDATEIELPEAFAGTGHTKTTIRKLIEHNHLVWFLKDTEDNGRQMSEVGFTMNTTTK